MATLQKLKQDYPKLIQFGLKALSKFPTWKSNGKRVGGPKFIIIHNTANSASARNEASYVLTGDSRVSYHFAVDETEAWQVLPLDQTSWNSGRDDGNDYGIAIEICRSLIPGDSRYPKSEDNGARLAAALLKAYKLPITALKKHQDFNGKYCPHRILDGIGWTAFTRKVEAYMEADKLIGVDNQHLFKVLVGEYGSVETANAVVTKLRADGFTTHRVEQGGKIRIQVGAFTVQSNAEALLKQVKDKGYSVVMDVVETQPAVSDTKLKEATSNIAPKPAIKDTATIAKEVLAGQWSNGSKRKELLEEAGYSYAVVQDAVNELLKGDVSAAVVKREIGIKEGDDIRIHVNAKDINTGRKYLSTVYKTNYKALNVWSDKTVSFGPREGVYTGKVKLSDVYKV